MSTSGNFGLSDIDVLALSVRDRESRRLIREAITAYRGGALRSALMSTWIAVAYDIIAKTRELASQGEKAPKAFVKVLDDPIKTASKQKLQEIESKLLTKANKDLQLLAPHEYAALERLQKDRHLCAHPAFVVEDELYQPSPELVRAHIVHALQHLLLHAPLQGKSAIARFDADLLSASFPATAEQISAFLRTRYLDRAKDVLVINLVKAIVSAPFGAEGAKYAGKIRTLALTLREIAKAKTAIYDSVMPGYVAEKLEHVTDEVLLRFNSTVARKTHLVWNPKKPNEPVLWESTVELGHDFFHDILRHPFPLDMNILKALKKSPLGLDFYMWTVYRTFSLTRPLRLSWPALYRQFGADPSRANDKRTVDNFRTDCLRELKKIKTAWPELNYATAKGVLILSPSAPTIPRLSS